jgi:hypothetical protein
VSYTVVRRRRSGFPFVKLAVVIVLVAGFIGGGYFAWQRYEVQGTLNDNPAAFKFNYASPAVTTPSVPAITSTAGLGQAMNTLNETDVTGSSVDSTQLGVQASGF